MSNVTSHDIAKMIDHSLLHPTLTDDELIAGCELAKKYDVASCCVKPCHTALAKKHLEGSDVKVCAVISFPAGNSNTSIKVAETEDVIRNGATEIDVVINVGKAIQGDWDYVEQELAAVNDVCVKNDAKLKVIFCTDYLNDEQIVNVCKICSKIGVAWVKTSTGYNYIKDENGNMVYYGATDRALKLMYENTPREVEIKAAGKCRTLERFLEIREKFGVTRVGASATAKICEDARVKLDGATPSGEVAEEPKGY